MQGRARHTKENSIYLFDPASGKHISFIGAWGTEWGTRLPVIESLRPSVYLPECKLDKAEISEIYIKELVGSGYDNQPLGELVFEGNNLDSLVLTQRTFFNELPTSGPHLQALLRSKAKIRRRRHRIGRR